MTKQSQENLNKLFAYVDQIFSEGVELFSDKIHYSDKERKDFCNKHYEELCLLSEDFEDCIDKYKITAFTHKKKACELICNAVFIFQWNDDNMFDETKEEIIAKYVEPIEALAKGISVKNVRKFVELL